jgi:hypothetical protein
VAKLLDQPENVEPDGYGHRWGRVQLAEVRKYAAEWAEKSSTEDLQPAAVD